MGIPILYLGISGNKDLLSSPIGRLLALWWFVPSLYWVVFGDHGLGIASILGIVFYGWAGGVAAIANDLFGFSLIGFLGITECPCNSSNVVTWLLGFGPTFIIYTIFKAVWGESE